ncbi:phosphatidylinositol mannoside acyltransferase [Jidongwangia harbinensis]|uniref:phosphatidylinositol mannoside acyltransferase n=1 Tax=Jidongwangia harbinensis TaxID=2878561 RepID=UPI001CD9EE7D|nr:phosphatidylinositol mannoside acyltransferase [Jidongwangia harbinensis]MCA2214724.1 phosphatidylinositol mannoside acyltransferase [Jidongwangia harbinensis]
MRDRLTELGFVAGWRLVRALPLPVARALFDAGADRAFRADGPGTQRLRRNLRRVVGPQTGDADLDRLVRAGLRSYARYWMEAFRLPSQSRAQHIAGFRLDQLPEMAEHLDEGRGVILALPHLANWDAAAAFLVSSGYRLATVAERLKPEAVYRRFLAYREALGMEVVPLTGGPRPPLDVLAERVDQGYAVALLADRDLSKRGVEVRFFGGRTRMPPGPALLALRTGAPLFAVDLQFRPDLVEARLTRIPMPDPDSGNLEVRTRVITQRLADAFEVAIADHPEDWHMLQKLWLDEPALAGRV